ncbi:MAG: hypothetical protein J6A69_02340 [Clostridia bacterium]|nr:hypothetical protein [Clostridia bacterium]
MKYSLILNTPNENILTDIKPFEKSINAKYGNFSISMETKAVDYCTVSTFTVTGEGEAYLSVEGKYYEGVCCTFSGEKTKKGVYRQSPHNVQQWKINTSKEAVPMAGVLKDGEYEIIMSDNPAMSDNYTTQITDPENKKICVCSGDNGEVYEGELTFDKYYHKITKEKPHVFTVVLFRSDAKDLNSMRKDVFYAIDKVFGEDGNKFHAICFSSNYMHYRRNEMGVSDYWIIPGIEYCNTQYPRDAFWQSMILPPEMAHQCYNGLYKGRCNYAENACIFIFWSYRNFINGYPYDKERLYDSLDYIKDHVKDNCYITGESKTLAFRSWYDICSFENDDCLTYNQGFFVLALMALDKMEIEHPYDTEKAIEEYNNLFLEKEGYYPMSRKKPFMITLDPTIGDLLAYIYFDRKILNSENVKRHYKTSFNAARTDLGCKVTCRPDGSFCTLEDYSAYGKVNDELATHTPGYYSWGGSYYIYEMLFHMDAYIHGAENAEENLIWRSGIDFKLGGTYFEHINTVTGDANKANQGWNACIYALWQMLIDKGVANDRFFREMDKIL